MEIVRQHRTSSYTRCIIAHRDSPDFQTVINARWLSDSAPPPQITAPYPDAVYIPLSVLDKLVHLILSQDELRRTSDVTPDADKHDDHLATTTPRAEITTESAVIPHCDADNRSKHS